MSGPRLLIEVEGQTEEDFVNRILRHHLLGRGYELVVARLMGNARARRQRGGVRKWPQACRDIIGHLREDRGRIVATMVDYYALPDEGSGGWPGRTQAAKLVGTSRQRAEHVEAALSESIMGQMGSHFDPSRFVPFVAMHEFEGLLFSDCQCLATALGDQKLSPKLLQIRSAFTTPEDINDSKQTAPSKRLISLMASVGSRYEKVEHGNRAFEVIGLPKVRAECPHFDGWLQRLEALAGR